MERAYVLINCDLGSEKQVIEEIKNLKNVKEVHGTLGSYDIIATVESKTPENVRQTVIGQIRKFDHIRSTLTLMGIESVKKKYDKGRINSRYYSRGKETLRTTNRYGRRLR